MDVQVIGCLVTWKEWKASPLEWTWSHSWQLLCWKSPTFITVDISLTLLWPTLWRFLQQLQRSSQQASELFCFLVAVVLFTCCCGVCDGGVFSSCDGPKTTRDKKWVHVNVVWSRDCIFFSGAQDECVGRLRVPAHAQILTLHKNVDVSVYCVVLRLCVWKRAGQSRGVRHSVPTLVCLLMCLLKLLRLGCFSSSSDTPSVCTYENTFREIFRAVILQKVFTRFLDQTFILYYFHLSTSGSPLHCTCSLSNLKVEFGFTVKRFWL